MPWAYAATAAAAYIASEGSKDAADTQAEAANRASAGARFTPYSTSNRFGSTSFTTPEQAQANQQRASALGLTPTRQPDGTMGFTDPSTGSTYFTEARANNTVNGDVSRGTDQSLRLGNDSLRQAANRSVLSPEALARDRFSQYQEYLRPTRAMDFDKLLGGLAMGGQLGYSSGATGTNPLVESFAKGIAREDQQNYYRAIDQEQALTDTLASRGQRSFAGAGAINSLAEGNTETGAALGGRSAGAGASAGNFTVAAGNASADAQRTQANSLGAFVNNAGQNQGVQTGIRNFFGGGNSNGQQFQTQDGVSGTGGYL
jgi:hypothetical protein